jgi:hypothetical protein
MRWLILALVVLYFLAPVIGLICNLLRREK